MNETTARQQMTKIAAKQAETGGTENRRDFAEWMLETTGYVCKTEKERAAFLAAAMMGQSAYKVFQAAKPTSTRYVAPEPVKPVRKPRARKAAAAPAAAPAAAKAAK